MFTHLHVHTEFSMLDGLSRLNPLVNRASELKMDSLAITDHGGIYGAIDFYRLAKAQNIKPIIGCEMYVAPGSRFDKRPESRTPYHLTVLAKNAKGYGNLVKLVTKSHLEGFYYKPRVDRELLQEHYEGLIVLSGCPSGEVPKLLEHGKIKEAQDTAFWYKELFGDYYLELMRHDNVTGLNEINEGILKLNRETELPLVVTNDSHYIRKEDAPYQDILICIHTNTNINDNNRLRMIAPSYYLKSPDEMTALFPDHPDAITNTGVIADMCNLELDFSQIRMPEFKIPDDMTPDEYLSKLCFKGLEERIDRIDSDTKERLLYELEVVKQTMFANYFLVVWDIAKFARSNDIFFAVRGSAAASLILYCLRVTDVNPLLYRLVFERFLNVERKEMPDIDIDFQDDRREEIINYVVSQYGRDHVAQIITFGTLGARASIRDVGRVLAMAYADVDRIARLIPTKLHITLDEAVDTTPELKEIYESDVKIKHLIDTAKHLEGITRHSSTHAAGFVISKDRLDDVVPLQKPIGGDDHGATMTQYAMEPIAALGLLKLDFLGLSNLTVLSKTRDLIFQTQGIEVTPNNISLNDSKTFELLAQGETVGVFQLESSGMSRYIKELKPTSIGDVAAMIALYRPGPMEHITTFIEAKHGQVKPKYPHDALKDILEETYGVIVYQDQVLLITRTFAGYSLGEADIVRKAMGKKIPEIMEQENEKFLLGASEQGYSPELAEEIFSLIEPFAGYAFNKAHSVSYGLISYWTAYLKSNYTVEYMASLMNTYLGNTEKVSTAIAECRRLNIPVLPPDINQSQVGFALETSENKKLVVRFGLAAIKNVSAESIRSIEKSRRTQGSFSSIEEMCRVADMSGINRKTLESLIKSGAFDTFGDRSALLTVIDRILSLSQSETKLKQSDQATMFDLFGESVQTPLANIALPDMKTSRRELWNWERDLMGVQLSDSDILYNLSDADSGTIVFRSDINPDMSGKKVSMRGQIHLITHRYTRTDKPFLIANVGLMDGQIDVLVWEDLLNETQELWKEGTVVVILGTVRNRNGEISISCSKATEYNFDDDAMVSVSEYQDDQNKLANNGIKNLGRKTIENASIPSYSQFDIPNSEINFNGGNLEQKQVIIGTTENRNINVRISESDKPENDESMFEEIKNLLLDYPGNDGVILEIATEGRIVVMEWPMVRIKICEELESQLQELLGTTGKVSVESKDE